MRAKNIPPDADKFFCVRGESLFKKRGDLFKLFHAESGKQSYPENRIRRDFAL